jgi:hypothetical protein
VVGQALGLVLLELVIPRTAEEFWSGALAGRVRWQEDTDARFDGRASIAAMAGPIAGCWYRGEDEPNLDDDSDINSRYSDVRQVTISLGGPRVLTKTGRARQSAMHRLEAWEDRAETLVHNHRSDIVLLASEKSGLAIESAEPRRVSTIGAWHDAVVDWGERIS